jgi:DNA-binding transcriptional regulator YiaG
MHHPDSRMDRVALPFCHLTLSAEKAKPFSYPKVIKTLGDHLRARRIDKKLFQKDVAPLIGASVESINHWETNTRKPEVRYYPRIMEFLGYCPIQYAKNFSELLILHRTHLGLSHRTLGKILNTDPGTISRWESGERNPYKKHQDRINNFFGTESLCVKVSK